MKHKKKKKGINPSAMRCQYCGGTVVLRSADGIYHENHSHTMLYVCSNYPRCDAYVDNFKSHCTACEDMERRFLAAPYPVEKLDFYFVDSAERAKYLARVQDVRAWVVPCESAGVEINAIGTDKGSGLQALCRCLNIPISATIAIGDSENDRPLLRDAGLPLAMGNAIADVKAAARYVMPDCDHDGVAEAIERFLLAQS